MKDNREWERIFYAVYIDGDKLPKLARKAAENKSKETRIGPVLVKVTKIEEEKP